MDDAVTLHHMAEFFETRCENLEVKPTGKKSDKKTSKKCKAVQFATSDKESSEDEKPKKTNKLYCLYHRRCGHSSEKCSVLKDLVKQSKKKKANHKKPLKKTYTKHKVNALVDRKLKKALKFGKKRKAHKFHEFENLEISEGEKSKEIASSSSSNSSSNSE